MLRSTDIPQEVLDITTILEANGYEAYLVGGCVRDLLLNKTPKDWDITTDAVPEAIIALFPESYCNNDYGTVGIKTASADPRTQIVEVTPYRTESQYTDARRPDNVTFGVSLTDDLARRDFTINAIAFRPQTGDMVDAYAGVADLKANRLKAVRDPNERFAEDALRMMRAVRLAAELDFMIDADTMRGIFANRERLTHIATERIAAEFMKLIASHTPMQGIIFLEKLGLLPYVLPELEPAIGCEQGGIHAYDVYEHLLRTLQAAADKNYSLAMRLAALLHDIGKPATRRTGGKNKHYTFFGHEVVGARLAKAILERLKQPRELIDEVVTLVRWHMFFADTEEITLSAVRRTITRVGEQHIEDLLNLRVCDRIGTGRPKEQPFRFRKYKAMVDAARRDPISVKLLKLDGGQIMQITGEKPGKRLGYMLHALLEEVLIEPGKNTTTYLTERVRALATLDDAALTLLASAGKAKQAEEEEAALRAIARTHRVG